MTCPAGQVCTAGSCSDACAGAVCPEGERCELGACVPIDGTDGGVPPPVDAGSSGPVDAAGPLLDAAGLDGGAVGVDAGGGGGPDDGGCGCRAAGAPAGASWLAWAFVLTLAALRRRRR